MRERECEALRLVAGEEAAADRRTMQGRAPASDPSYSAIGSVATT